MKEKGEKVGGIERARYLLEILKPGLKMRRCKDWSSPRFDTEWGTKTEMGMVAVIYRVMYDSDWKPKPEDK
jgi:hypothetical protein